MIKLSNYIVYTSAINPGESIENHKLILYSTVTDSLLLVGKNLFADLQNACFSNIPKNYLEELKKKGILVNESKNEFEEIIRENVFRDNNTLGLVLHSTANCQLGCSYCGQNHEKKDITTGTKERIKKYIKEKLESGNYKYMYIVWHGSEPLMSYSNLTDLSRDIITLAAVNNVRYRAKIITNGLSLKPSIFNELFFEHNITNFQITVDGSREFHDLRRVTKQGKATFDIIMDNIIAITQQAHYPKDLNPLSIRVNIDKTNQAGVFDLLDYLKEQNIQDKINIDFRPVENYADNKFKSQNGFSKEEYAAFEIELILYAASKGIAIPFDLSPKRTYDPCMAVKKDFIVIDVFGNLFPCYNFPYTENPLSKENLIGNINFDEDTYTGNVPLRNWYKEIETTKNACYTCNLLPICGGYCPLKWQEGEIACPSFKYNIEDRLVLTYINTKKDIASIL